MTEYLTATNEVVIAYRIPNKIDCNKISSKCSYSHHVEGEVGIYFICEHPQAEGKRGGWLKKCPLKKEVERGGEA